MNVEMIKNLPHGSRFYWKGKKFQISLSPKNPPGKSWTIVCSEYPQGDLVDMPSGRKVKPVVKA